MYRHVSCALHMIQIAAKDATLTIIYQEIHAELAVLILHGKMQQIHLTQCVLYVRVTVQLVIPMY